MKSRTINNTIHYPRDYEHVAAVYPEIFSIFVMYCAWWGKEFLVNSFATEAYGKGLSTHKDNHETWLWWQTGEKVLKIGNEVVILSKDNPIIYIPYRKPHSAWNTSPCLTRHISFGTR